SEVMVSLGQQVDAYLPDGTVLRGRAVELDADGSLLLRTMDNAEHHVLAGDIQHLRRSDGSYA
ncbi:MAG: biotin--[acetyl-CoA-carboxylase] ligase, partial [Paeniglutamicibacter terrestris]